jgi:hypothetical protein
MAPFLDKLQLVAHEPLTYVAFLALVGAWLWRAYFLRTKSYIDSQRNLPKRDQLSGLQLLVLGYPAKITKNHLTLLQRRYFLVAFIATLICIIILAGLITHYWSLPADEVRKHLGQIEGQNNKDAEKLSAIESEINKLAEQQAVFQTAFADYLRKAEKTSEPPPPSIELIQAKKNVETSLADVKEHVKEYSQAPSKPPLSHALSQIDKAEQVIRAADETLLNRVTLKNNFIQRYKDRATISTNALIDKVGGIHTPQTDGDIHIAGRADEVGLTFVAEIMNAKDEQQTIKMLKSVEGIPTPIALAGVWRIWFESGGASVSVQGEPMTPAGTTNPAHVFEIHPVTSIDNNILSGSIRPIVGFTNKDAQAAFLRFENALCKIARTSTTTTLECPLIGFNYPEFILEVNSAAQEIEDGWLLPANVYTLDNKLLARTRRMVFVKGTAAGEKVNGLRPGNRLHVLGMPRVNFAEVENKANNANGEVSINLPYEMVIVGIFGEGTI